MNAWIPRKHELEGRKASSKRSERYTLTTDLTVDDQSPSPSVYIFEMTLFSVQTMHYYLPLEIWASLRKVFQVLRSDLTYSLTALAVKKEEVSRMIFKSELKG